MEAVNCKARKKVGSEKLVNAVLRRILCEGLLDIASIKRKNKRDSIAYSLPVVCWFLSSRKSMAKRERKRFLKVFWYPIKLVSVCDRFGSKDEIKALLGASDSLWHPLV